MEGVLSSQLPKLIMLGTLEASVAHMSQGYSTQGVRELGYLYHSHWPLTEGSFQHRGVNSSAPQAT